MVLHTVATGERILPSIHIIDHNTLANNALIDNIDLSLLEFWFPWSNTAYSTLHACCTCCVVAEKVASIFVQLLIFVVRVRSLIYLSVKLQKSTSCRMPLLCEFLSHRRNTKNKIKYICYWKVAYWPTVFSMCTTYYFLVLLFVLKLCTLSIMFGSCFII